jgi:adenylate kinase family enzyme
LNTHIHLLIVKKKGKGKNDVTQIIEEQINEPVVVEVVPEVKHRDIPQSEMFKQLGEIALQSLNKGEAVKEEIIIHLIVEKIRTIPASKGWIIDGFPTNYEQAKLLEKALTGYDDDAPVQLKPTRESILASDPNPPPPKIKHRSAIDTVIYLDLTNEEALKRSVGRFFGTISHSLYHQQFKPPPEGSHTGLNRVEMIEPCQDTSNDMEQIQHRITTFEDNEENLLQFYQRYSHVEKINAQSINENIISKEIQKSLKQFIENRELAKQREIDEKIEAERQEQERQRIAKQKEEELERKRIEEEEAALLEAERVEAERLAKEAAEKAASPTGRKGKAKSPKGGKQSAKPSAKPKSPSKPASPKGADRKKSSSPKGRKKSSSPKGKLIHLFR